MTLNFQLERAYRRHQEDDHPTLVRLRAGDGRFVPGVGPIPARVMFVGEAPGETEAHQGKPFVGPAGSILDGWLSLAGLNRREVRITNAVKYRPADRYGHNRTPRVGELDVSRDLLALEATVVSPEWIVCLGTTAVKALWNPHGRQQRTPAPTMTTGHGQVYDRHGRSVFIMYHPAAVLHDPAKTELALNDAREFGRLLDA